ncbi:ThiF family adenylyltransferase [Nocardioides marmoraquaticus]
MCPLELANDRTVPPGDHTMMFEGARPYTSSGQPLTIVASEGRQEPARGIAYDFVFSRKPTDNNNRYRDFYHKVTTYVRFLEQHAQEIDAQVTARTNTFELEADESSVFRYSDTATTRAKLEHVTEKLSSDRVAIVGLGGTGSYVLDLVAKTPVREIHLFDGDRFIQHNAFRAPGAPAGEQLEAIPAKVEHFEAIYSNMHRGIVMHPYFIDETNVSELADMSFVFVAVDDGSARRLITDTLGAQQTPFVDVGMGLYETDAQLGGQLRVTTSTPTNREQARSRMPMAAKDPNNQYAANIQIADLNALNAVLAVIKWKKLLGFYQDTDHERNTVYVVGGNALINEDCA